MVEECWLQQVSEVYVLVWKVGLSAYSTHFLVIP